MIEFANEIPLSNDHDISETYIEIVFQDKLVDGATIAPVIVTLDKNTTLNFQWGQNNMASLLNHQKHCKISPVLTFCMSHYSDRIYSCNNA